MNLTEIFVNEEDFLRRKDKKVNGVSQDFADKNSSYKKMNETNIGCWNCIDCNSCVELRECIKCDNCQECSLCKDCQNCYHCNDCSYCSSCDGCSFSNNCEECVVCIDCEKCNLCCFTYESKNSDHLVDCLFVEDTRYKDVSEKYKEMVEDYNKIEKRIYDSKKDIDKVLDGKNEEAFDMIGTSFLLGGIFLRGGSSRITYTSQTHNTNVQAYLSQRLGLKRRGYFHSRRPKDENSVQWIDILYNGEEKGKNVFVGSTKIHLPTYIALAKVPSPNLKSKMLPIYKSLSFVDYNEENIKRNKMINDRKKYLETHQIEIEEEKRNKRIAEYNKNVERENLELERMDKKCADFVARYFLDIPQDPFWNRKFASSSEEFRTVVDILEKYLKKDKQSFKNIYEKRNQILKDTVESLLDVENVEKTDVVPLEDYVQRFLLYNANAINSLQPKKYSKRDLEILHKLKNDFVDYVTKN